MVRNYGELANNETQLATCIHDVRTLKLLRLHDSCYNNAPTLI